MSIMEGALRQFTDPGWWLSVVVVSLAMSLLANWLYARGELFLVRRQERRQKKLSDAKDRFERQVALAMNSPEFRAHLRYREIKLLLLALVMLSFAVLEALWGLAPEATPLVVAGVRVLSTISVLLATYAVSASRRPADVLNDPRVRVFGQQPARPVASLRSD